MPCCFEYYDLILEEFQILHFVSIIWSVLIFSAWRVNSSLLHQIIFKTQFSFFCFNIVFEMINVTICLFLLICFKFLNSIFDVRRYNGCLFGLHLRASYNEIYYIYWWIGKKKKSISSKRGGHKVSP